MRVKLAGPSLSFRAAASTVTETVFPPDACLRIVDGRQNARAVVLGDDDLRMAEPLSLIGEGDVEELLLADHVGVPVDDGTGVAAFPDGHEEPYAPACHQQNHDTR